MSPVKNYIQLIGGKLVTNVDNADDVEEKFKKCMVSFVFLQKS